MIRSASALAAVLAFGGLAFAGTDISLPAFHAIDIHGGGEVILRHGPVQRVTVIQGDLKKAELKVVGNGTLDISPCKGWCWGSTPFKVEIVSPRIDVLDVHGGGSLKAEGQFPVQPKLTLEVHGGGDLDTRAIPADAIEANVHGGGDAFVQALKSIDAEVHGGGDITYIGNPQQVRAQSHGGGAINHRD